MARSTQHYFPFLLPKSGFIVAGVHNTIIFSYGMFIVHFAGSQLANVLSCSFTNTDERDENLWVSARLENKTLHREVSAL